MKNVHNANRVTLKRWERNKEMLGEKQRVAQNTSGVSGNSLGEIGNSLGVTIDGSRFMVHGSWLLRK